MHYLLYYYKFIIFMFTMQFHFQRGNRVLSPARKVTHSVSLFCWYFNVYLSAFCLWAMGKCSWHHDIDISTNNFSKILSLCVSYFTSVYVMKWKDFFPNKELKEPPYFDARAVCYPNLKTIRDYLAWRQVDCKLLELIQIILYSKRHLIFVHTTFFLPWSPTRKLHYIHQSCTKHEPSWT
jgi:hypothetical protein